MKPGDLIMFAWPNRGGSDLDWEHARLALVIDVLLPRPSCVEGGELLVMHDGERWVVPQKWCRFAREGT